MLFSVRFPSNLEQSVQGAVSVLPEVFLKLYFDILPFDSRQRICFADISHIHSLIFPQ